MITLITGGIKSGKSAYALQLAGQVAGRLLKKGAFIATADRDDVSMKPKIAAHQKERQGLPLETIEEKIEIAEKINNLDSTIEIILIDCLTLWMGNLMYHLDDKKIRDEKTDQLIETLAHKKIPAIVITNEVGLGIIPENKLARQYQDELGLLNSKMARAAGAVFLMVSSIPVKIK